MANEKSIVEMCRGGVLERIDMEMAKVLQNINDWNTDAKKARTVTVKVTLRPSPDREKVSVSYEVTSKLAPATELQTSLSLGTDGATGEFYAVENTPNLPGQMNMDGSEQEPPQVLKVKFG
jgi:hypothetical protein